MAHRMIRRTGRPMRRSGALLAVAIFIGCCVAANAAAAPIVLSVNNAKESVSLIDTQTHAVLGEPIKVGDEPTSIAITPDGRLAFVSNGNSGSVSVIDIDERQAFPKQIPVGGEPQQIAISPDGTRAYVADQGASPGTGRVSVIDTGTRQVVANIPLGGIGSGIAVSPDGKTAYVVVGRGEDSVVEVIDTRKGEVVGPPIPVGEVAYNVVFSPDGRTAYVTAGREGVVEIDTATRESAALPIGEATGIALTPDGKELFLTGTADKLVVVDSATGRRIEEVEAGFLPKEVTISPDGKQAFVADLLTSEIRVIDTRTFKKVAPSILLPGSSPCQVAITPDQSPTAAFTAPTTVTAGAPAAFDGAASTDPDGSIASWGWAFGDGATASGESVVHAYKAAGGYEAQLSVVDDEGCGEEMVFTGRTAYCSGSAPAVQPMIVKALPRPQVEPIAAPVGPPSNNFTIRRVVHNRRNGTVRMQVKLPSAGFVLLFGRKVHAVTRKSKGVQSMWLTLHARVELAKRLKKVLRAPVRFRITFTPNGGTAKTVHRRVTLVRAPRHQHRGH